MAAQILWGVVGGLLLGVFARSLFDLSWPVAYFLLLLAILAFSFAQTDRKKRTAGIVCAVALVSSAFGMLRFELTPLSGDPLLSSRAGEAVVLEGVVFREPDIRETSVHIPIHTDTLVAGDERRAVNAGVLIYAPLHSDVEYGDRVRAKGRLQLPERFDTGLGHTFNYPLYLAKDGILYTLSFAEVEVIEGREANPAKVFALGVKHLLLDGLHSALPEPHAGLAAGLILGEKRAAGGELSEAFIRSSLIHIVVLSGYNITIVINAASRMLSRLPRWGRFGANLCIVTFFILMTGGAATAVRAGLMALLAAYARLTGRLFIALRVLAVAAAAMVVWNPFTLAFDPSFQLSVLATLGLILFTSGVARRLPWITEAWGFREIAASTVATQLTVLPLLLYQSGTLSLVALPANVLALVAVPPAMAFSAVASLVGLISEPLGVLAGVPAYALLTYIIKIAEWFSALPFASFTLPAFGIWLVFLAYVALFGMYGFVRMKKRVTAGAELRPS